LGVYLFEAVVANSGTTETLIAAASGLAGAVVGSVVTLVADHFSRRFQVARDATEHDRDERSIEASQRRKREESAAEEIDRLVSIVANEETARIRGWMRNESVPDVSERTSEVLLAAHSATAYLPADVRARVSEYLELLENASDLVHYGKHSSPRGAIIWKAANEAHELIAGFLRFEDLLPETAWLQEIREAADELAAMREEMYLAEEEYRRTTRGG
jgi:hypothetical protein